MLRRRPGCRSGRTAPRVPPPSRRRARTGRGRAHPGRARALHLDHDALAALEPGTVHPPDRPAASGCGSMRSNTSSHGTFSPPPSPARPPPRSWRHVVLQAGELGGDVGRIRSGRRRIWPSLAKVGPSSSSVSRRRAAWFAPFAAVVKAVLGDDGGDPAARAVRWPPASSVTSGLAGFGSPVAVTITTVQRALCETRWGRFRAVSAAAAHLEVADDGTPAFSRRRRPRSRPRGPRRRSPEPSSRPLICRRGRRGRLRSRGGGPGTNAWTTISWAP